jgi:hypothetical protein
MQILDLVQSAHVMVQVQQDVCRRCDSLFGLILIDVMFWETVHLVSRSWKVVLFQALAAATKSHLSVLHSPAIVFKYNRYSIYLSWGFAYTHQCSAVCRVHAVATCTSR